ncbi:MAG: hypothetical protein HY558_01060 [Euryarchaeota archaeon]|nr:hypothetical protein [Euryarchaeota archaeon]
MAQDKPETPPPEKPAAAPPPAESPPSLPEAPGEVPKPTRAKKGIRKTPSEPPKRAPRLLRKEKEAPAENAPRRKKPGQWRGRLPPPRTPKVDLERFIASRLWERYPETRRMPWPEARRRARRLIEDNPELLENYTRNRRAGEQEAMGKVYLAADTLTHRIEAEAPAK